MTEKTVIECAGWLRKLLEKYRAGLPIHEIHKFAKLDGFSRRIVVAASKSLRVSVVAISEQSGRVFYWRLQ